MLLNLQIGYAYPSSTPSSHSFSFSIHPSADPDVIMIVCPHHHHHHHSHHHQVHIHNTHHEAWALILATCRYIIRPCNDLHCCHMPCCKPWNRLSGNWGIRSGHYVQSAALYCKAAATVAASRSPTVLGNKFIWSPFGVRAHISCWRWPSRKCDDENRSHPGTR